MRINRQFLAVCRTVHIYLTMFGLFVMLLFGITGLTINHEGPLGATNPVVTTATAETPQELIKSGPLDVVEHVRQSFHITGAMTGYEDLGETISIGFKSPGQAWDVEIEKSTGKTSAHIESSNFIAVINNLHRGRYSGAAWGWVIDISAILIVIACASGFVLWLVMPKRRMIGLAAMISGTVVVILFYYLLVPGADEKVPPQSVDKAEKATLGP